MCRVTSKVDSTRSQMRLHLWRKIQAAAVAAVVREPWAKFSGVWTACQTRHFYHSPASSLQATRPRDSRPGKNTISTSALPQTGFGHTSAPRWPTIAAIAAIIGISIEIALLTGAGWWFLDQMIQDWDAKREEIVCALFNSGTSDQAAEALVNGAIDSIQSIVSWGALGPISTEIKALLSELFGQLIGNPNVKPLFEAVAVIQQTLDPAAVDCDACLEAGDCNTNNQLFLGTGTLAFGSNVLTPELSGGQYKIDARLRRGTCLRATAGPGAQLYQYYRCQNGSYAGPYKTQGAPDNVWSCGGKFVYTGATAATVTLELGDDDCDDEDTNCP